VNRNWHTFIQSHLPWYVKNFFQFFLAPQFVLQCIRIQLIVLKIVLQCIRIDCNTIQSNIFEYNTLHSIRMYFTKEL